MAPAADAANLAADLGVVTPDSSPTSPPPSLQLGGVTGFRDLLPEEAEVIREAQESLLAEMRRWGYRHDLRL